MLGSFMKFPVPPPIKVTVEDGGFCNGRLSCYQCFDCLLPENPAFCIRPNTSLEMELHLGRISFCTVEVREGVVRRGCGFDPVEFPEVWWPDCTFTNWDHLNSQCKCYGQMCNDKFFYRNLNLGDEIIGKLSKFLPTPRSIPTTLTNPPEGVILCHLCDIEAKGALAESCYRPPTKDDIQNKNRTVISCDTSAGESCFKEYKFSPTNTSKIFQAYRIQKKGCRQANETGFKPLTRFEAERGCVLNSGPGGTISCNCVSNLCNVYTKCHQCFGSLGKCDSTRIDYRIPGTDCVNEFLRPRERLSTSSRNEIGVAHMCSMLLSEQVVSRVCTPIMDFGTGLGSLYFLTEQPATFELPWYVPAPCNRWGKGGFERWDWSYFECTCWAHGCNSREILGVRGRTDSKKVQRELNAPPKKSKYSAQPF
ncbi:uncharacterized protein LOC118437944 [Folsomia candida]|nr:uncharacterized protein LOC118437944 [Folsomia candida]